MPAMMCKCGEKLSWSAIPNPIEWKFIADQAFDKFVGNVDAEKVYSEMSSFLRCPACQRLWVFWNGFGAAPAEYELRGNLEPGDAQE